MLCELVVLILLRDDGREDDSGEGGSAENVMDAPLPTTPPEVPAEVVLTWGNRGMDVTGV